MTQLSENADKFAYGLLVAMDVTREEEEHDAKGLTDLEKAGYALARLAIERVRNSGEKFTSDEGFDMAVEDALRNGAPDDSSLGPAVDTAIEIVLNSRLMYDTLPHDPQQ